MKGVPAAVVAIAIAIAGVADEDAAQAAVLEEVTVVATPAVAADGGEGRIRVASLQQHEGSQRCGPFSVSLASSRRAEISRVARTLLSACP